VTPNECSVALQNKEELGSSSELDQVKKERSNVENEETGVQLPGKSENLDTDNQNRNEADSEQKNDLKSGHVKKPSANRAADLQQKRKPRMEVKDVPFHMVQLKPVEREPKTSDPAAEKTDYGKVGSVLR
jgi:hypothetical protein